MNVRLAPKSFEFNRKSHDEYSDSGMRSKKSKAPTCVKQYSALCAFLTHELISTKATQQIVLGSVPATALPWEQGKALRASICLTFGAKKKKTIWQPLGLHRQVLWDGSGFVRLDEAASGSLGASAWQALSWRQQGRRKDILHGGPQAVPNCLAECHKQASN